MGLYGKYNKLSDQKIEQIVLCFSKNINAKDAVSICDISLRTINEVYKKIRLCIYKHQKEKIFKIDKIDKIEYYIGLKKQKTLQKNKQTSPIVFGVFKIKNLIKVQIIDENNIDDFASTFNIKEKIINIKEKILTTNAIDNYHGIVDIDFNIIYDVDKNSHNMRSLMRFARSKIAKFHGIPNKVFEIYTKEVEFLFGKNSKEAYKQILKLMQK